MDLTKVHASTIATAILEAHERREDKDNENYHPDGFEDCACRATVKVAKAYLDLLHGANEGGDGQ